MNNAGIAGPTAHIEEISVEEWTETQNVNVLGPFLCTKHAAPYLRDGRGSVITISSIGGKLPYPARTPYAASKMAVIGFTRAISRELGPEVTANVVCPGAVEGDRIERVFEARADEYGMAVEEIRDAVVTDLPLDGIVPPGEIADLVAHLASPNGRHITGQDMNISSGAAWF